MDIPDFSQSSPPSGKVEKEMPRVLNQEVARAIVSSPNDFNLSCVEELTEYGAEVFAAADQSVDLYLDGLRNISQKVFEILSGIEGELSLGLSEITVTQAKCLLRKPGCFYLSSSLSVEAARYLSFRFGVVEVDPDQTPASLLDVLREAGQFSIQRISKSSSTVTVNEGGGFVDEFILSLNALKLNVRTIEKSGGVIHHVSVIGYENHFSLDDYPILNLLADMVYDGMSSGVDLGELDWPEFCQASAENGAAILSRKHLQSEYFKLTEDLIELMGQR
ncbi:hypothetical protein N9265_01365 [bacterium]|nr:hypothetical protein [bacterium]MDB4462516.1 hypothetical protein [Akkermansiaceae bacterium]